MADFRVDDTAPDHPKMRAAGIAALGLWSMAGAFSMRPDILSDGWVPTYWVLGWDGGKRAAAMLVRVGLWMPETRNGIAGYRFHDFLNYQRAAEKIVGDRQSARQRMATLRASLHSGRSPDVRANTQRTTTATLPERAAEPAPNFNGSSVTSLLPTPVGGSYGGDRPVSNRAREQRPPEKCPKHINDPDPPNCGNCADQRRTAETWDHQHHLDQRLAIRACGLCDGDGWRWINPARRSLGPRSGPDARCDHTREQVTT
ncbi:MAG TPA: hypothetical protein VEO01_36525 [Pseudonocardiaceae bacterium]|nr:hypothetical protein [Pseudonocardiaceae bacterium]